MVSLRNPSALPVVGVLAAGRTYRHLLYLLLAIPLGFAYSTLLTFGVVFGLALSVAAVGVVILLATLIGSRLIAGFERLLANALLGTDLSGPDDLVDADGALAGVKKYVNARSTWTSLGFVSLKFWASLFALVPFLLLGNALPLVAAPLRYPYAAEFGEVNGEPVTWAIDSLPEAVVALLLGVVGVLVALHVTNLVAYVARQMALGLLGRRAAEAGRPPTSTASGPRHGDFEFVDDPEPPGSSPPDREATDRDDGDRGTADRGTADRGTTGRDDGPA